MGYAGNSEPSYIFPTMIATKDNADGTVGEGVEDLDCFIGDQAVENQKSYGTAWPIRHGLIENFTHMEKFWQQSIFKYLRAEPEDHYVLLVRCFVLQSAFFLSFLVFSSLTRSGCIVFLRYWCVSRRKHGCAMAFGARLYLVDVCRLSPR